MSDATSGKSRPLTVTDHRHRYTTNAPAIRLEFGARSFEWSEANNDTGLELVRLVNQGKGFLDYKALLVVHYVPYDQGMEIDLFLLLIARLLPHYTYPNRGQNMSFQVGWKRLQTVATQRWDGASKEKNFRDDLATFNDALEKAVHDLGARANAMLLTFGDDFRVEFHFRKAEFKIKPKRVGGPRILVQPAFRKERVSDYYSFFNEARLSALAICLFFAALKESPATGPRILALDDVLIGLDMTNRVKVLDLVHDLFPDWQIFIFTYSKAWFERLKERVKTPGWAAPWQSVVLWEEWHNGENSPRVVAEGSGDLLEMADRHLQRKDYTAAAVYARKALESLCYQTCAKASLLVLHVEFPKQRKVEHFINAIRPRLEELVDDARRARALELLAQLEQARAFVLNRNAHFDVEEEDTLSAEVGAAIEVVKGLKMFLSEQAWENANFHSGRKLTALEQMNAHLASARDLVMKGAKCQCRGEMRSAHDLFWQAYGEKLGVLVPLGVKITAAVIWSAAQVQEKLTADSNTRLDSAKGYLYGSVKGDKFDAAKFEEAATLLEELVAPHL